MTTINSKLNKTSSFVLELVCTVTVVSKESPLFIMFSTSQYFVQNIRADCEFDRFSLCASTSSLHTFRMACIFQLTWLSLHVFQGSASSEPAQEILSACDPISGGNTIPTDLISSKWKPWDLYSKQYSEQSQMLWLLKSDFTNKIINSI